MKKAIVFYMPSSDVLEKAKNYKESPDETKEKVYVRERGMEIEACAKREFPFFYIVERPSAPVHCRKNLDFRKKFEVYDPQMVPVRSLKGMELLLRSNAVDIPEPLSYIESLGGRPLSSWRDEKKIERWYEIVSKKFLKRPIGVFPAANFWNTMIKNKEAEKYSLGGKIFIKSTSKGFIEAAVISVEEILDHIGYGLSMAPDDEEIIISEPLCLLSDGMKNAEGKSRGNLEYRNFIILGKVASTSRYLDKDVNYDIPEEAVAFAKEFVECHRSILPPFYVLDVGMDKNKGPVVIELNPISGSGRYERNDFNDILDILGE